MMWDRFRRLKEPHKRDCEWVVFHQDPGESTEKSLALSRWYYTMVAAYWLCGFPFVMFVMVCIGAALDSVGVYTDNDGPIALTFVAGFMITGGVDALWRLWAITYSQRRFAAAGRVDPGVVRGVRLSRTLPYGLIAQLVVATALTVYSI